MKNPQVLILLLIICLVYACSPKKITRSQSANSRFWTDSVATQHFQNRSDSLTWDMDMFNQEIEDEERDINTPLPIEVGIFPVPDYDLLGEDSFKGLITGGGYAVIKDKDLKFSAFSVKRNELNKSDLETRKDEIFFTIITLTDTIDTLNYNLGGTVISSRNHPNYVGEGFLKTKDNRIDFVAFKTVENESYAIINMGLFDLKFGQTILVAPQKDKTLRFLQVDLGKNQMQDLEKKIDSLLGTKRASDFFLKPGNI